MGEDAGSIYSEIRIQLNSLNSDIKSVNAAFDKLVKTNDAQSEKVKKSWTSKFKDINLAGVAAFAAIAIAVKKAVESFANFDESMVSVQAEMKGTTADLQELEEAALNMGSSSEFSAKQAADALLLFSKRGYDAAESIKLLQSADLLAEATNSELNSSATILAETLKKLGLEVEDSARLADVFAGSQIPMEQLSQSLTYISPLMKGFNMSLEESVAVLKILNESGMGQLAAPAIRLSLSMLAKETDGLTKKLAKYGIAYKDVNPATNSFAQIIGNLGRAGLKTSDIIGIFGNRAGPVMSALLDKGQKAVEEYTEALSRSGIAAEKKAITDNTLNDELKTLGNAFEVAGIKIVKEFETPIRAVVQFVTSLVNAFSNLPQPIKIFIGILAGGIPVIMGVVGAIGVLGSILGTVALPITIAVTAIAALTAGIVAIVPIIDRAVNVNKELDFQTKNLNKSIAEYDRLNKQLTDTGKALNEVERQTLENRIELARIKMSEDLSGIVATVEKAGEQWDEYKKKITAAQMKVADLQKQEREGSMEPGMAKVLIDEQNKLIFGWKQKQNEIEKAKEEAIKSMAEAVASGNLEIAQIALLNIKIADQVKLRAQQIKKDQELKKQKDKEAADAKIRAEADQAISEAQAKVLAKLAEIKKKAAKDFKAADDIQKKANEDMLGQIQGLKAGIDDQGASEIKLLENERARRVEEIKNNKASKDLQLEAIDLVNQLYDANVKAAKDKTAIDVQTEYENKLKELNKTTDDNIDAEREKVLAIVRGSTASKDAVNSAIVAINEYYDTLKDKTASDDLKKNLEGIKDAAIDFAMSIGGVLSQLFAAATDARIEQLDRQMQAELEAAGLAEQTAREKAQAEYDIAVESGDQANIIEKKKALDKATIEEEYEKKKAMTRYKGELAQWGLTYFQTLAEAARAIVVSATSLPWPWNLIPIAATTALTGIQIAAIQKAKPRPPKMATGGIVIPASSGGGRDVTVAENGSPELLLNAGAEGMAMMDMFASRIVTAMSNQKSGSPVTIINTWDGVEISRQVVKTLNSGSAGVVAKNMVSNR